LWEARCLPRGPEEKSTLPKRKPDSENSAQPTEQELELRKETARTAATMCMAGGLGMGFYAVLTWNHPHREVIVALAAAAALGGLLARFIPSEGLVNSRWRELFLMVWLSIVVAWMATLAAFDGGGSSPIVYALVLPVLFTALTFPLRVTVVVGTIDVAAFLILAVGSGDTFVHTIFVAAVLSVAAFVAAFEANNQARRSRELSGTAEALRASEEISRLQARQQQEVARFGQRALSGEDIDELLREGLRVVHRVLAIDSAGVVKVVPEEQSLVVISTEPKDPRIEGAKLPPGTGSMAGYTLATGTPVIVRDWETERRFEKSEVLIASNMLCGLTVMIRAANRAFGVLGVHCATHRDFGTQDVNFMQAIANVIGNAIERREEEERTRYEALHDPLTGLPNRNLFLDRLGRALAQAERRNSSVAVLFLDLDQFKLVNDSLGHAAGDELLAAVAPRIEHALRPTDTIARFGGDEFAVLAEVKNEHDATRIAERIKQALAHPFKLRQREHFVSASLGISLGRGEKAPEAMIRDADAALYRAKDKGRGGYEIFDSAMRARAVEHMRIENDLRRALERSELELHYQPIVGLREGSIVALEALLRWRHPEYGLTSPTSFIPVAEESLLIVPVGRWVIEEACRQVAEWQSLRPDAAPVRIAVNLSGRQIGDPDLVSTVSTAIETSGIDPATLSLELTETVLFEESGVTERLMHALRQVGVRLVLDDFGSGFSSLGYLKRFPLDGIKLDRSFIENVADGLTDAQIVRAVVEMARALGLEIVAEGVETPEQLSAVRNLGCHQAQGFYFMPPLPADEVPGLLAQSPWKDLIEAQPPTSGQQRTTRSRGIPAEEL
jgi:diguanylate cyclase (GGDEF)-like protein